MFVEEKEEVKLKNIGNIFSKVNSVCIEGDAGHKNVHNTYMYIMSHMEQYMYVLYIYAVKSRLYII